MAVKSLQFLRILAVEPDRVWAFDGGQVRAVQVDIDTRPGDILQLIGGTWCRVAAAVGGDFPTHSGDFARLSGNNAQRFHTIKARAVLLRAIRQFFDRRGFTEVDTPAIATSPGLELHLAAVQVRLQQGMGGSEVQRWLVTSPEYHCKRLLTCGFTKIYTMQHAFRSGERGGQHNPEFTMLEWYRAGADYTHIIRDNMHLIRHCALALASAGVSVGPAQSAYAKAGWDYFTVRSAIKRFAGFDPDDCTDDALVRERATAAGLLVQHQDTTPDILMRALAERVEPALRMVPLAVIESWPASMASLARRFSGAPHLAERFEIYLHGVEIANGFSELVDPVEQRQRFEADLKKRRDAGLPTYPIDERFLAALSEGCPPSAGVALGVDRLLMQLCGYSDIDEVLAFPFERA